MKTVGFSNVKGENMKYKLKALFVGLAGLLMITAIAGFMNFFVLVVGTHVFLAIISAICALYLCYLGGDLYLKLYHKENTDA